MIIKAHLLPFANIILHQTIALGDLGKSIQGKKCSAHRRSNNGGWCPEQCLLIANLPEWVLGLETNHSANGHLISLFVNWGYLSNGHFRTLAVLLMCLGDLDERC